MIQRRKNKQSNGNIGTKLDKKAMRVQNKLLAQSVTCNQLHTQKDSIPQSYLHTEQTQSTPRLHIQYDT